MATKYRKGDILEIIALEDNDYYRKYPEWLGFRCIVREDYDGYGPIPVNPIGIRPDARGKEPYWQSFGWGQDPKRVRLIQPADLTDGYEID